MAGKKDRLDYDPRSVLTDAVLEMFPSNALPNPTLTLQISLHIGLLQKLQKSEKNLDHLELVAHEETLWLMKRTVCLYPRQWISHIYIHSMGSLGLASSIFTGTSFTKFVFLKSKKWIGESYHKSYVLPTKTNYSCNNKKILTSIHFHWLWLKKNSFPSKHLFLVFFCLKGCLCIILIKTCPCIHTH